MAQSPLQWKRGNILGRGSSATVSLAIVNHVSIPNYVAVKSAPSSKSSLLKREKEILDRLQDCPQIIKCYCDDLTIDGDTGDEFYHIFLELGLQGDLLDLVKFVGPLPENDIRSYTKSILLALHHMHQKGYVHCDVKLDNILVWSSKDVKLADFGHAKSPEEDPIDPSRGRGTRIYKAPESVERNECGAPADIWALGCTVFCMAVGKPPQLCLPGIASDCDRKLAEMSVGFSESGKDFLRRCLVIDPTERWTAEKLLKHPFVADQSCNKEDCFVPWFAYRDVIYRLFEYFGCFLR